MIAIKKARVGLYRPWAPSIDEGWTRWILENYGFEPKSIYKADMRSSELRARYDVIVLPDMSKDQLMEGFHVGMVPGQYAGGIGPDGVDNLRAFVRDGGMLVASNRTAANLIPLMSLPLKDVLEGVKSDKFFCSGALLGGGRERGTAGKFWCAGVAGGDVPAGPAFVPEAGFKARCWRSMRRGRIRWRVGCCCIPKRLRIRRRRWRWSMARGGSCCMDSSRSSVGRRMGRIGIC